MENKNEKRERIKLISDIYELAGELNVYIDGTNYPKEFELDFEIVREDLELPPIWLKDIEDVSVRAEGLAMEGGLMQLLYTHEDKYFMINVIHVSSEALETLRGVMADYLEYLRLQEE